MKSSSKEVLSEVGRPGQFEGRCGHYSVSLRMMSNGSLLIEVEDSLSLERWWRLVDESLLKAQEDPFYQSVFADPAFIFDYLSENFSAVSFTADVLSFAYSYGTSAKSRTKVMAVPLAKQERELELAHLRIDKMNNELAQRDFIIKQLKQKQKKTEDLLINLTQKLQDMERKFQNKVTQLQIRMSKEEDINKTLLERCKHVQQRLQKEEQMSKILQEKLKIQKQRVLLLQKSNKSVNAAMTKKAQSLSLRQQYCQRFIDFRLISHHLSNSHSQYYALTDSTLTSAKIARIRGGNIWYNFVNKTAVLPSQHNNYAVKLVKTTTSYLYIGFCTEKGLGQINNFHYNESAYYCCWSNGLLREGGVQKKLANCGSLDGEIVECSANLLEGKLMWRKGDKMLIECVLPLAMKGKHIYLSIILHYEGDLLEVNAL